MARRVSIRPRRRARLRRGSVAAEHARERGCDEDEKRRDPEEDPGGAPRRRNPARRSGIARRGAAENPAARDSKGYRGRAEKERPERRDRLEVPDSGPAEAQAQEDERSEAAGGSEESERSGGEARRR